MTLEDMRLKAKQISSEIDDILKGVDRAQVDGAINWADLRCCEVGITLTDSPITWTAVIEEASPAAYKLATWVHNELYQRGHDVAVRCEW